MSQKNRRRSTPVIVYFLTFLITATVVGLIAFFIFQKLAISSNSKASKNIDNATRVSYSPSAEYSQNILFVGLENDKPRVLSLVRIDTKEKEILCVPVPPEAVVQINTEKATLSKFYEKYGIKALMSGIELIFDIPVQRYCVFNDDGFKCAVRIIGGAEHPFPTDMYYENPDTGEVTDFKSGQTEGAVLYGDDIRKLMTYPCYTGGKEFGLSMTGSLTAQLANTLSAGAHKDSNIVDDFFGELINSSETNITHEDYAISRSAFQYVLSQVDRPATFLVPRGIWEKSERFVISDDFLDSFRDYFNIGQ